MTRFLLRRLLLAVVTLLLTVFLLHSALALLPGDPVRALFGPSRPDPAVYAALRTQYHFDDPFLIRYVNYVGDLLRGDLGRTFPGSARGRVVYGPPVTAVLAGAVPISARILGGVLVVQALVGVVAGAVSARRRGWGARAIYATALLTVAVPVIVTAFALQAVVGWELGWLPVAGMSSGWRSYLLPVVTLSAAATAYVVLITRSELLDTLNAPYIRMARARSLPEGRVVNIHAMRPSLVPVVTVIAANFGQLLTGLVIVEGVFRLPGVGGALFGALQTRDPALLIGLLLCSTVLILVASLAADVLQGVIDRRVRLYGDEL